MRAIRELARWMKLVQQEELGMEAVAPAETTAQSAVMRVGRRELGQNIRGEGEDDRSNSQEDKS